MLALNFYDWLNAILSVYKIEYSGLVWDTWINKYKVLTRWLIVMYVVRCVHLILGFAAIYVESTMAVISTDNQRIHNTDTCQYSLHSLWKWLALICHLVYNWIWVCIVQGLIQINFCYKPLQTLTERKLTWMKIKLSCKILLGTTSLISIVDILNIMYQSLSTHTKYVQQ